MHIRIKRVDKTLPIPQYKTKGAAGFDLYTRTSVTIKPREIAYIPMNVVLEIPAGTWVMMLPRSSAHKLGVTSANSVGVGDSDFCGDNDEYLFPALNFTDKEVTIERGTRIAQMILVNYSQVHFEEVDSFNRESRGGFGSTGMK